MASITDKDVIQKGTLNILSKIEIDIESPPFDCSFFFVEDNQPYSLSEFVEGSYTRKKLEKIQDAIYDLNVGISEGFR